MKKTDTTVSTNRKAYHNYEILDKIEAGIVLKGLEVKAVRQGEISIAEAWVRVEDNVVTLVGSTISPKANKITAWETYSPNRDRKLLLKKKEIRRLKAATLKGATIIPLKVYFVRGYAKVQIATAKGKKNYDKRRAIADRDAKRKGY